MDSRDHAKTCVIVILVSARQLSLVITITAISAKVICRVTTHLEKSELQTDQGKCEVTGNHNQSLQATEGKHIDY